MRPSGSGWHSMVEAFEGQDLTTPPVPLALRQTLKLQEPWCWATRGVSSSDMYLFKPYPVHGVFTGQATDYIAISHAGHGVNSYAVTYHLVYRGLAIFTQVAWGGIYLDNVAAAHRMAEVFSQCNTLIELADERESPLDSPWRLLCLDSGLREVSAVGWVEVPDRDVDAAWRFSRVNQVELETALDTAIDLMRNPPRPQ